MDSNFFKKQTDLTKEAKKSEELVKQLRDHEAKWPEIQSQIFELGAKEWEVLQEVNKHRSMGNYKRIAELSLEYNKIHAQQFGLKHFYTKELDDLHYQIELLTKPVLEAYQDQLDDLIRSARKSITIPSATHTGYSAGDAKIVKYSTNIEPMQEIAAVLFKGQTTLKSMTHNSIPEINLAFNTIIESVKAMPTDDIEYEAHEGSFLRIREDIDEMVNGPKAVIQRNDFGQRLDDLNYNLVQSAKQNTNWMEIESIKSDLRKLKGSR